MTGVEIADELAPDAALPPVRWSRWLVGYTVVCAVAPLLLTSLFYGIGTGFDFRGPIVMVLPFLYGAVLIGISAPGLAVVLACILLAKSSRRSLRIWVGAALWGALWSAFAGYAGDGLTVLLTFPVGGLIGGLASALLIRIAEGREGPVVSEEVLPR